MWSLQRELFALFLRICVNELAGVPCLDECLRLGQSSAFFETVVFFVNGLNVSVSSRCCLCVPTFAVAASFKKNRSSCVCENDV